MTHFLWCWNYVPVTFSLVTLLWHIPELPCCDSLFLLTHYFLRNFPFFQYKKARIVIYTTIKSKGDILLCYINYYVICYWLVLLAYCFEKKDCKFHLFEQIMAIVVTFFFFGYQLQFLKSFFMALFAEFWVIITNFIYHWTTLK